ncbi:SHOCT domain-containing protein [Gordonia sp. SID5947]|uniref:SHOCT domain-containing protein n=1 Tax=Gordonia sp. SID5947 TaxID=2690315 RepID=UPI00136CB6A8|nr:SHOCT domain-containing protein [Gordonia sp. SID5947]MYR07368.1 SHOCT domain-containing protein [Gordonia sp. SID5947]
MDATLTPEAENAITDIAHRHGLSREAVLAMLLAVSNGGGTMAQFSIPELGGPGQWIHGGMTMVGNMSDHTAKARVDALCGELARLPSTITVFEVASHGDATFGDWWPDDLGVPSRSGGQNDTRYAIFPQVRRLAIQINGVTRVYDTGEHHIGGVQQQQGGNTYGSVTFTSQLGTFDVEKLQELRSRQASAPPAAAPDTALSEDAAAIIAAIESLAGLHERGILSDEEFSAKKAELLGRL